jgi:3-phenylpropionate/trans-cinnamate dioxygenase ferredoxin subunit
VTEVTTAVCALADIESGTARRFVIGDVAVAVVRIDDDVYALADLCSHANVSLSDGEVWCEDKELECPKHSSTFSLVTGEPQTLPATQPVAVYAATVVDGQIVITTGSEDGQ